MSRNASSVTLSPARFTLCLALGLWLGALAVAATAWLALQLWPQSLAPLVQAVQPSVTAPAPAPVDAQQAMFERYQLNLQRQQAPNAQERAVELRNLNDPKCQFWLQQHRTAPTANSQAHVTEFCN
ncbi:hypothetical protein [Pseudomonas sp.]|uniref:hypothetical protein n=1 Tax=Pseudomonas sp. TaxID=306 RepID=UPI0028A9FA9F|nr:hypothetical protein [Pseudomonas sp.]